jgi:hypothetical protein
MAEEWMTLVDIMAERKREHLPAGRRWVYANIRPYLPFEPAPGTERMIPVQGHGLRNMGTLRVRRSDYEWFRKLGPDWVAVLAKELPSYFAEDPQPVQ